MVIKLDNKERKNALLGENVSAVLVDYESFNEVKNYNKKKIMEAPCRQNLRKHTGEKPFTRDQCDFKKKQKQRNIRY